MYVSSITAPSLAPRTQPTAAPSTAPSAAPTAPQAAQAQQPTATPTASGSPQQPQQGATSQQLAQRINTVVAATKQLDQVWTKSMLQLKAAVSALGKDGKLDAAAAQAASRILFIGKVLQIPTPNENAAAPPLPNGTSPSVAIVNAEKSYIDALGALIKSSSAVMGELPNDAPKEVAEVVTAIRERITDSLYAVKFSRRLAPPPAMPAPAPTAGNPSTTPAPAAAPAPGAATPAS